jgi:pimeloyl-ACP methyl ester carboxylesterase
VRFRLPARPVAVATVAAATLIACGSAAQISVDRKSAAPSSTTAAVDPTNPPGTTDPSSVDTVPSTLPDVSADFGWEDCGQRLECGSLSVPVDYDDEAAGRMEIYMIRHLARPAKRIGSLLVNPGGPGVPGSGLAENADRIYSKELLDRFDIIGFDPRGVGRSNPVDCVNDLDPIFSVDPTPDDAAELETLKASAALLRDGCADNVSPALLANISTADVARDMDRIRAGLGEEKISYFGFSYGSELGAVYATMFPDTMRAVVLDGAVNPNRSVEDTTVEQATNIERITNDILNACVEQSDCEFAGGGDPLAAYDELAAALDANPVPTRSGRPAAGNAMLYWATVQSLYSPSSWPGLWDALADAKNGKGRGLLDKYDSYLGRGDDGSWDNSFEALLAIRCLDDPGPISAADIDRLRARVTEVAPRMGPVGIDQTFCALWPAPPVAKVKVTAAGAGTILLVGATGDPVTPLSATKELASQLQDARVLIRNGDGHTSYASGSSCIDGAVDDYLINLKAPDDNTTCG